MLTHSMPQPSSAAINIDAGGAPLRVVDLIAAERGAQPVLHPPLDAKGRTDAGAMLEEYHQLSTPSWDPGAGPHPTGGYAQRRLSKFSGGREIIIAHFEHADLMHRTDGPASVRYLHDRHQEAWVASELTYDRWGVRHREDGPAMLGPLGVDFFLGGSPLVPHGLPYEGAGPFYDQMLDAGRSPREAVSWLAVSTVVGADRAITLMDAGADVTLAQSALDAGIEGFQTLTAVATGVLPLSWATA